MPQRERYFFHISLLTDSCISLHPPRRSDFTYFDLQIIQFSCIHQFSDGGSRGLPGKLVGNFGGSREILFDSYGDSRENLLEISAVVIISSPISSVCGIYGFHGWRRSDSKLITTAEIPNKFSREFPYISNTFSRESPKFQTGST